MSGAELSSTIIMLEIGLLPEVPDHVQVMAGGIVGDSIPFRLIDCAQDKKLGGVDVSPVYKYRTDPVQRVSKK